MGTAPMARSETRVSASRTYRPAEAQWLAVQSRDREADGAFVYAVRSTGVYCRPSCPSRKPQRAQVEFFLLPEAAEQRGFRPCLRCRPRTINPRDPRAEAVARVCREIEARIHGDAAGGGEAAVTLAALSGPVGMGPHQLERAFRSVIGITPRQYADAQRMRRLKSRLRKGDDVTTALYDAGYGSSSRLYERAPSHLGMTPATYRRGGAGMRIHYTIANSPLGRLLVGATDRGISALYLGESDARLEGALKKEYPRAEIRDATGNGMECWVEQILAHLRGRAPQLDLPTDVRPRHFSGACGKSCGGFRMGRRAPTVKSPGRLGVRRLFERLLALAPQILSPWLCHAIAWCARTGSWLVTAGDSNANARCSSTNRGDGFG